MMNIRLAQIDDCFNISTLCQVVWIDTYATDGIETSFSVYVGDEFSRNNTEKTLSKHLVLVAETDKRMTGVAIFDETTRELKTIYVLPRFQKKGIGKALINHIQKITQSELWLNCWVGNTDALSFYKHIGFLETGETTFELDGKKHKNIVFSSTKNH